MAASYNTPGVYIEEISKFPPSVAEVETAIPVFIGYTQQAIKNGNSIANVPTKISSLLEYELYFGVGFTPVAARVVLDENNNFAVKTITLDHGKRFYLYDSIRLFYDNGGGDCYIVSVGLYTTGGTVNAISRTSLEAGLDAVEREDEPTILLFPDAGALSSQPDFYSVQQEALMQCAKLQDRVSIFDLYEYAQTSATSNDWAFVDPPDAAFSFRTNIGITNLNYGMAYTPWLYASYDRDVAYSMFHFPGGDATHGVFFSDGVTRIDNLATLTSDSNLNGLVTTLENGLSDIAKVNATIHTILTYSGNNFKSVDDGYKFFVNALVVATGDAAAKTAITGLTSFVYFVLHTVEVSWNTSNYFQGTPLTNDVKSYAASTSLWRGGATDYIGIARNATTQTLTGLTDAIINTDFLNDPWLGVAVTTIVSNGQPYGTPVADKDQAMLILNDLTKAYNKISAFITTVLNSATTYANLAEANLYSNHPIINNIVSTIALEMNTLPPSGAVAGIYARVDAARGVWKAPANEGVISVTGPIYGINNDEQGTLNIDTLAGKSINAIRAFTGRGVLVWGARTLTGNDNDWRYISVRRFAIMVEQSCKNAAGSFVFEPNDGNTWAKVQGMIENFLTLQWRAGALQGAKASDAFYVSVGLNKTMSAVDILEGRMIVEIGMAIVHPAEFIILRFSQMMAQS